MSTQPRTARTIDKQILMEFYKVQWNDINDMNNLDWRVALIFIPLIGAISFVFGIALEYNLKEINYYTQAIKVVSLIVYLICLYGLWTVAKGQAHSILKFKTLSEVEKALDLHGYIYERPKRWRGRWAVFVCRRVVLYLVYSFLGWLSLTIAIFPLDEWDFFVPKNPLWFVACLVAVVFPILFVGIHWKDYKLHMALGI